MSGFDFTETKEFIKKNNPDASDSDCKELYRITDGLPLALSQALAYIEVETIAIYEYVDKYNTEGPKLFAKRGYATQAKFYPKTVLNTWSFSRERVRTSGKSTELLNFCAYLNSTNIPKKFLQSVMNGNEISDDVKTLYEYSLVKTHDESISIHKLLQDVVRIEHGDEQRLDIISRLLDSLLAEMKGFQEDDPLTWKDSMMLYIHLKVVLQHTKGLQLEELGYKAYFLAARIAGHQGEYQACVLYYESAQQIGIKLGGDESIYVANVYGNLAIIFKELGALNEGRTLLEKSLEIILSESVLNDREMGRTLINLAESCYEIGDLARMIDLLNKALPIIRQSCGELHHGVGRILMSLARAHNKLGEKEAAISLTNEALNIFEKNYGKDCPLVARTYANLGVLKVNMGNKSDGRKNILKGIDILIKIYGTEHREIALARIYLAKCYDQQMEGSDDIGDAHHQKDLIEQALPVLQHSYGPRHYFVAHALTILGNAYGRLENKVQQKRMWKQSLKILDDLLGSDHIDVAQARLNYGNVCGSLGNQAKKVALLERVIPIFLHDYGQDDERVAIAQASLSSAYFNLRSYDDALICGTKAFNTFMKIHGRDNRLTIAAFFQLMLITSEKEGRAPPEPASRPVQHVLSMHANNDEASEENIEHENSNRLCVLV